ncbi:ER membrane complex subunit 6 [Coelomomyces lativittatus]|nr:ER membrane complex subunit 6 [Coelomomyces lativittatus]KAJ1503760.1 ER membrane complex subunit 6 [Coelomomyces lativittatus]KAJ1504828.1 ER membrane complex subunit 6 [Coelomomyces lativittatus]
MMSTSTPSTPFVPPTLPVSYSEKNLAHNAYVLDQCRSSFAILQGMCAGILGLPSVQGFLFFFVGSLIMSTGIYFMKRPSLPQRRKEKEGDNDIKTEKPASSSFFVPFQGKEEEEEEEEEEHVKYFLTSYEIWTGGLTHGIFAYILFWTMANGILRTYG